MRDQLDDFLCKYTADGPIKRVIFEGVKSRIVLITVGAFISCYNLEGNLHATHSFVSPLEWKKWAKDRGATGPTKDVKGILALEEIGWDFKTNPIFSDDVADSILIFLTWKDRHGYDDPQFPA